MPTTFTTTNYDAQSESRVNPSRLAATNVVSGSVEFAVVSYTLAGTEAAADVVNLCLLPAGAIPIPELSSVTASADPATTDSSDPENPITGVLTIDIGTAADTDGWADGIDLSAGGKVSAVSGTLPAWVTTKTPIVANTGSGNAIVYATVATQPASSSQPARSCTSCWRTNSGAKLKTPSLVGVRFAATG
jgi:hypothetical protein